MNEFIEKALNYFLYGGSIFVCLYWLIFIPNEEKVRNIKNTINNLKNMFNDNKDEEPREETQKKDKK
ncbi:hypothetical protein Fleli_0193 [Bernardetia litoralis DSM 6794]|uniref:Uncharacterized protein n=1 Tax=Bernardetia litoralis (strain ATCC 23117 / DSM 6794 / NBRC 15988 / NCIMB 1366 / Fx l1 / Sio-4) TaxID=880071 RepID=I4AFF6_BERLS|nr:hypothetical protein [Bernardetia litoralis]AFM02691.1 hypothetical protein Fleli_0193 [Bernardetia litoralis DSM 6794]